MTNKGTGVHPIISIGIMSLVMLCCSQIVSAQICDSARLNYIVRDTKGRIIDASALKPSDFIGEQAKYWKREVPTISFTETGHTGKPVEVKSLSYVGGGDCKLRLDEVTLKMGGQTMHLIFGRSLRSYGAPGPGYQVIDSLPFQQGTFTLEATSEENVPASKWKKVRSTP